MHVSLVLIFLGTAWAVWSYSENDPRAYFGGIDLNKHVTILWNGPKLVQRLAYLGWIPILLIAELMLWSQSTGAGLIGIAFAFIGWKFIIPWLCNRRLLHNEQYQKLALMIDMANNIDLAKHAREFYKNSSSDDLEKTAKFFGDTSANDKEAAMAFYKSFGQKTGLELAIWAIDLRKQSLRLSSEEIRSIVQGGWHHKREDCIAFLTSLGELMYCNNMHMQGQTDSLGRFMQQDFGRRLVEDCLSGILSAFPDAMQCLAALAQAAYANGARTIRTSLWSDIAKTPSEKVAVSQNA